MSQGDSPCDSVVSQGDSPPDSHERQKTEDNKTHIMKIKTVIFDIGGVMVGLGRIRFFEQFGYAPKISEQVMNSTVKSRHWKELDRGILTDEEVIDRFVKDAPELENEIRHCMENVHGIVYRLDTSIPWIRSLKDRGMQVLYLSNYSMKVAKDNEDAMDFLPYMDGGLLSCDYKVIKPDPDFYQILIDKYDLVPSECVFLDDLEANLETARQLGIHTIRVKDHEQAKADLEKMLESRGLSL